MTIADRRIAAALREAREKIHSLIEQGAHPQLIDAEDLVRILDGLVQKLDPIPR